MTRVVLDSASEAQFANVTGRVEVCSGAGRILGFYLPVADPALYDQHWSPFTSQQLDEFEREPGGRSLAEIISDLEKRA